MRLTHQVATRIARRMRLDGFEDCVEADVWDVYRDGYLIGRESLSSRILNEFDEYGVEAVSS